MTRRRQHEAGLHELIATHLKVHHPGVIFRTDFAAGIKMTMGQAIKHKKLQEGKAYPDLFIAKPWRNARSVRYLGMYLEIKDPTGSHHQPFLKDGVTRSEDKHIKAQWETLDRLTELGYYCRMAVGLEQAKLIIDWYLAADHTRPEPTPAALATAASEEYETIF